MKCYRKNGSDHDLVRGVRPHLRPSMKCYRKNGSDRVELQAARLPVENPSMKCYRKNGSDPARDRHNVFGA